MRSLIERRPRGHGRLVVQERDRGAGVDQQQVAGADSRNDRGVHGLEPRRRADGRGRAVDGQHLGQAAFVGTGHAHALDGIAHLRRRGEQAGMLEADVRQLPQHVVLEDEPAVVGRRRHIVVDPQDVIGGAALGTLAGPDPDRHRAPCDCSSHDVADDPISRGADRDHDVTRGDERPQRAHEVGVFDADRRERRLADDDRVDELDGDMAGVFAPLGRHAPHRRSGRAPPGERERGEGERIARISGRTVTEHPCGERHGPSPPLGPYVVPLPPARGARYSDRSRLGTVRR